MYVYYTVVTTVTVCIIIKGYHDNSKLSVHGYYYI